MNKTALLAVLPLVFTGTTAFAEASEEGAAHLLEVFQTYLGTTEGVVAVTVDGDAYAVTLDATPLTALATEAGGTATVAPIEMTVSDNGDGTWDVSQDQAFSFSLSIPGQVDMISTYGKMAFEGVFDEALMSFSSAKGEVADAKTTQKMTDPTTGEMTTETAIASITFEMTGTKGAMGGVDGTYTSTATGYSGNFVTPASEGMPPMTVGYTVENVTQSGTVAGMRPDAFYKAVAWFVANPTDEAKEANKSGLKDILAGGLPFFDNVTADMVAKKVAIASPMGEVGLEEVGVLVDANGAVADGKLREAITLSGLTLPAGLVPDWAAPILPQKLKLDFQLTDFDAAAGLTTALGLFDLPMGTEPDDAFNAKLLAAFVPSNALTVGLNPGFVSGDGYELTYEGSMAVPMGDMPIPTGKAVITLAGIETLQAALAAAPPEMQGQAMMGIGMAQGMAKPGPNGELVWEIDASTPGSLLVNGMDMMGMQ